MYPWCVKFSWHDFWKQCGPRVIPGIILPSVCRSFSLFGWTNKAISASPHGLLNMFSVLEVLSKMEPGLSLLFQVKCKCSPLKITRFCQFWCLLRGISWYTTNFKLTGTGMFSCPSLEKGILSCSPFASKVSRFQVGSDCGARTKFLKSAWFVALLKL